jgi:thiol-disulfide isomerase/thioredoxin
VVKDIKANELIGMVKSGSQAVIKFYSKNCKYCVELNSIYVKLSEEFTNLEFYKISIDSHPESTLPEVLMFAGVPSILLLNGRGTRKYRFLAEPKKPSQKTWYTKEHVKQFLKKNFKEIK